LKDDPDFMLEVAKIIKDKGLTSAKLKTLIDDHFKVEANATEEVLDALELKEIGLRDAAVVSEAE
jgi:hypothetical protein